ncbi:uridylate-specific endoribonuclease-like [Palaemon carinicauda]|uniref:uridylate-specific endoribonuclease-like n=1 Tax=Palaemon carinicauda TaxID=392227 RepID=UPI0035B5BF7F
MTTSTVCLLLLLAAGVYSQSCVGRCGNKDLSQPCQCNSACEKYGDCCADYAAICYSCQDRCSEIYLYSKPCQCNDDCPSHGNCCNDFESLCGGGGGGVTDAQLRELTEALLLADVNDVGNLLTVDRQGKGTSGDLAPGPYFANVPPEALSGLTISALIALQDNYIADVNDAEVEDPVEIEELDAFLTAIMATEVMDLTNIFLVENNIYTGSLREKIKEIWFDFYSRGSTGAAGSSGFEHSFVGEIKNGKVSGFHNWVHFYHEEQDGDMNYEGWSNYVDLGDKGEVLENHFEWLGYPKPLGGMFVGTSPELELAVYTVCFLARPDSLCPVQMNGVQFKVQTWTLNYGGKVLVGSAYPDI